MDMNRLREALRMGVPLGSLHYYARHNDSLLGGDSPAAPDYTPMAQASKESAEIMAKLGREQLTESKRQYDTNMAVAQPVVEAQLGLMQQTRAQGDDYYNYGRSYRPAEMAMMADAYGLTPDELAKFNRLRTAQSTALAKENWTARQKAEAGRAASTAADASAADRLASQNQLADLLAQKLALQQQLPPGEAATQDTSVIPSALLARIANSPQNQLQKQIADLDAKISAIKGQSAATPAKASAYKLAGSQILDGKFFLNGAGFTAQKNEDGSTTLLNAAGRKVGAIDANGKALKGTNSAVANAFLNTQQVKDPVGGAIGKFSGNQYFAGGQAYYFEQGDDGRMTMFNAAGVPVAAYGKNAKGDLSFSGNAKLLQQALSDRSYYSAQDAKAKEAAASSVKPGTVTGKDGNVYDVVSLPGGGYQVLSDGKVVATVGAGGEVSGDKDAVSSIAGQEEFALPESERLAGELEDYQSQTMLAASNRQKAAQQAAIDEQAGQDATDRAKISGLISASDTNIYDQNSSDIETNVGRAVADSRSGYANSINQFMRQGARYGFSPGKLAAALGTASLGAAQQQAQAANATRTAGITDTRNRLVTGAQTGMQLRQQDFGRNRGYSLQDKSTDWAKKLDTMGLVKGNAGYSQGAYSLANTSGNSAVGNQMTPSTAYMGQRQAAAGTIGAGQQMQIQGLGSVLGAQTSAYNADLANSSSGMGGLLGLANVGVSAYKAGMFGSDIRMKEGIQAVGTYPNGLPMYEFSYKGNPARFRGVMAQDVAERFPEAVVQAGSYLAVDYSQIGISMEKVN